MCSDSDRSKDHSAGRPRSCGAPQHRCLFPAPLIHRTAGTHRAGASAGANAARRSTHRRTLAGSQIAARRAGTGTARRDPRACRDRLQGSTHGSAAMNNLSAGAITRRQLLASALAVPSLMRGASISSPPITMGFLYNGPKNDLGYNQSHADGKAALRPLTWVRALEEASVPETVAAEESMRDMIFQDGASVIFATSFGYFDPFIINVARENPAVQFFHCGGLYEEGKHPRNIGIYFGFIDEVEYLSGMLAGLATRTGKIGFVAAKPIPQVLRNI